MFVESMSFVELRDELDRDIDVVTSKIMHHYDKIVKVMRQTKISSHHKYYNYTSPRKNQWVYQIVIDSARNAQFQYKLYSYFFTKRSYAVIIYSPVDNRLIYCTSHFFTRYSQRTELHTQVPHDIILKYLDDNSELVNKPLKKVADENDVWQSFHQQSTGVGLGYMHKKIAVIEMRTFINNDMLKGTQIELSKALEEKFKMHVVRSKPED